MFFFSHCSLIIITNIMSRIDLDAIYSLSSAFEKIASQTFPFDRWSNEKYVTAN